MPPIDPRPNILLAHHDAGGSGSEAPAERPDDGAGLPDRFSPPPEAKPPSQRAFRLPLGLARTSAPKRLTKREISEALKRAAEGIAVDDPTGSKRDEAKRLFPYALEAAVKYFKPEKTSEGAPPSEAIARRALRSAYRSVYPGEKIDRDDAQIEHLVDPFLRFLHDADVRFTLGLTGTKTKARKASAKNRTSRTDDTPGIAARILRSRQTYANILDMRDRLGRAPIQSRLSKEEIEDIETRFAEAEELAHELQGLGTHERDIERSIASRDDALLRMEHAERMRRILARLRFYEAEATTDVDPQRVEQLLGGVRAERDAWIDRNAPEWRDELEGVLEHYLRFWLSEQAGDVPPGMRYSPQALGSAIAGAGRDIVDEKRVAAFESLAHRMISSLVRRASTRSRRIIAANDAGPAAASAPTARHIANREQFAHTIGRELFEAFETFFQRANFLETDGRPFFSLASARPRNANAFYELFTHYVRYAANVYGDDFNAELLRTNGLEPRFVRSVFSRVDNAQAHAEGGLALLREFFAEHVTDRALPPLEALLPTNAAPASAPRAEDVRFVAYEDGMAMEQYLAHMPFAVTPEFRAEFEQRVGYSFDAFRNWGSVRRRLPGKTQEEWSAEVEAALREDRLEDVTQEPRTAAALDAMLPAFWFLFEQAREHGMAIDAWDFLAAIYPVARRMRAAAVDGVITVTAPSFMQGLAFRNWGYPTFARLLAQRHLDHDVKKDTQQNHAGGDVAQPEYRTIRQYTVPLAEGSGGGLEQERRLYAFAAGFMRFAPFIDNVGRVFDSGGGMVTFAPADMPSRFTVQIEEDAAVYASGRPGPKPGAQRALLMSARSAAFDQDIALVRDYLQELRELPTNLTLSWSDGTPADADALWEQFLSYTASHHYYRALLMDRSASSSTRSAADLREISDFYTDFAAFRERIVHFLKARGSMPSRTGPIVFETGIRLEGRTYEAERWGRVTLLPQDAFETAQEHGWDRERRDELIRMQVYAGRAAAVGDLDPSVANDADAVAKVAREYWKGDEASLERAAADYALLGNRQRTERAAPTPSLIERARPLEAAPKLREPILPSRRRANSWSAQWSEFALARGMSDERVHLGTRIMSAYFNAAYGFHTRFWDGILDDIIRDEAPGLEADERRDTAQTIADFFGTIGVENGQRHGDPSPAPGASSNRLLAQWAVEDYLDAMPIGAGDEDETPIHESLLSDFVALHCRNARGRDSDPAIVLVRARQILKEYRSDRNAKQPVLSLQKTRLPSDGLFAERLAAFARPLRLRHDETQQLRHAYFRLYDAVRGSGPVSDKEAEAALAASGRPVKPYLTAALQNFIRKQQSDLAAWRSLAADPELGFPAFVRSRFRAPYITDAALIAFANEYAGDRLTHVVPTDPHGLSLSVVSDAFSPYRDLSMQVAASYRALFLQWSEQTRVQIDERLSLMRIAVEETARDSSQPPESPAELLRLAEEQASGAMGSPSFDWRRDERALFILHHLTGEPFEPSIEEFAFERFETSTRPAGKEHRERIERERAQAPKIADFIIERAHAMHEQAARTSLGFQEPQVIAAMSAEGLRHLIKATNQSEAEAQKLLAELDEARDFGERLEALSNEHRETLAMSPETIALVRRQVAESREKLEETSRRADATRATANERLSVLEARSASATFSARAEEVREQALDAVTKAEGTERALAGSAKRISEMEADVRRMTQELSDLSGDVEANFEAAAQTLGDLKRRALKMEAEIEALGTTAQRLLGDSAEGEAKAGIVPAAIASLNASDAFETEQEIEEQFQLHARLEESLGRMQATLGTLPALAARTKAALENATDAIHEAEGRMPAGEPAKLPKNPPLPEKDGRTSISSGEPKKQSHIAAQKLLAPIRTSGVLTVGDQSHLLAATEAQRAQEWIAGKRRSAFRSLDIFGRKVNIPARKHGVRIEPSSKLPKHHPFARVQQTVSLALSENSMEATILSYLGRPKNRDLLLELLIHLVGQEAVDNAGEAKALIREWSLAHAPRLQEAIGPGAARIFVTPHTISGIDYSRDHIPATFAEYTPETHLERGHRYARTLLHPEIGRMVVDHLDENSNRVGTSVHYVDIQAAKKVIKKDKNSFEVFRVEDGTFIPIDISRVAAGSRHIVTLDKETIGDLPERGQSLRMLEAIYSDVRLMALGWLFGARDSLPRELSTFIEQLLKPISNTAFGSKPPFSLLAAQDAAVIAYMDLTRTCNAMPELERVLPQQIDAFIDLHVSSEAQRLAIAGNTSAAEKWQRRGNELKAELRGDSGLRRELALIFLLAMHAMTTKNMSTFGIAWDFFKNVAGLDFPEKIDSEQSAADARKTYREIRNDILATDRIVQNATGLHAPQHLLGYVPQDEELSKAHPETLEVGSLQMKQAFNSLVEAADQRDTGEPQRDFMKALARMMDAFPEFGGALTIIALLFEHLPLELAMDLIAIVNDYDAAEDVKQAEDIEIFRKRFRSVYRSHSEAIHKALELPTREGISFARHLTGLEYPWLRNTSWDLYNPSQKLFTFVPEFARTDPGCIEHYFEGLGERAQSLQLNDRQRGYLTAFIAFADHNPELRGVLAMLPAILDALPEISAALHTDFFTMPRGAWNDEEAAARLIGAKARKVHPARAFVEIILEHLPQVRNAILQPIPNMGGKSSVQYFTGRKEPWKPNPAENGTEDDRYRALLPLMDHVTTADMKLKELSAHIESRLWKLTLLTENERKLAQKMGIWEEKQQAMIEAGKKGIPNSEQLPRTFIKMMLAIERTDILLGNRNERPLTNEITELLAKAGFESHVSMMHIVYTFMLGHREEIGLASRKALKGDDADLADKAGKKEGGEDGGTNGAPSAPDGSPAPAPTGDRGVLSRTGRFGSPSFRSPFNRAFASGTQFPKPSYLPPPGASWNSDPATLGGAAYATGTLPVMTAAMAMPAMGIPL